MKTLQNYETPSVWTDMNLEMHDFCMRQINTTGPARNTIAEGAFDIQAL